MNAAVKPPSRLYKYSAFTSQNLENLKNQTIYFGSPRGFNDPYDCSVTPTNAKNGYGAYGGYKRFIATKDGAVYLEDQGRVRSSERNNEFDEAIEGIQLKTTALQLQNKRFEVINEQAKADLPRDAKLSDSEAMEQARTIAFDTAWKARCG